MAIEERTYWKDSAYWKFGAEVKLWWGRLETRQLIWAAEK